MDKTRVVHVVDTVNYCASCQVIECATQLCNACLDELLQHMEAELDADMVLEQQRCEGGLY